MGRDRMEPTELWGVMVRTPSGEMWLDAGTLRYTPDGARDAGNEFYSHAHASWRAQNSPYKIRKFIITEAKDETQPISR